MKLFHAAASPFVRKVMVVAHELGLADDIETTTVALSPTSPNDELSEVNPLTKMPCLVLPSGQALFDSRVICEYLAAQRPQSPLFPAAGPARWDALRRQAIGDGICDAAVLARYETIRPTDKQWDLWHQGQLGKVVRALDLLEREPLEQGDTIGHVAIGCALGYLDLRYASLDWRAGRPALTGWFRIFGDRPSMVATRPPQ